MEITVAIINRRERVSTTQMLNARKNCPIYTLKVFVHFTVTLCPTEMQS